MSYFDGIKVEDRVWSFEYRYGKVIELNSDFFEVEFDCCLERYNFDGVRYDYDNCNQTLFWDKIEIKTSQKHKIKLKEEEYKIDLVDEDIYFSNGSLDVGTQNEYALHRCDKDIAKKALKQITMFIRLLALRDQECEESRGYYFQYGEINWFIEINENGNYFIEKEQFFNKNTVYFKTEEDAQKIADILNSGRFDLE
jgi:hypothetical protein